MCLSSEGYIYDSVGGVDSINKKEIKIYEPEIKIQDDKSRILRVIRFATEYDFTIEDKTLEACKSFINEIEFEKSKMEIYEIQKLTEIKKNKIIDKLKEIGFLNHEILSHIYKKDEQIKGELVENKIKDIEPLNDIAEMFNCECYLAGGATRDIIWGRKIKDLDIKLCIGFDEIIDILEKKGFKITSSINLEEQEYYVNYKNKTVSIFSGGYDIDLGVLYKNSIEEAIKLSDLNFNCCIYDIHKQKIINPEIINDIINKDIKFTDIDRIERDPLLILNALKQVSRIPEILVSEDIRNKIKLNSYKLMIFLEENKQHIHKLNAILNNVNSKFAISLLDYQDEILNLTEIKHKDIEIGNKNFAIHKIEDLNDIDKNKISSFLKKMYGKHFDTEKMFSGKNTHFITENGAEKDDKEMSACLVMQNSRIYGVAAISWYKLFSIVKDVVESNNDIWCSVDSNNDELTALALMSGMTIESDKGIIEKILVNTDEKYQTDLEFQKNINGLEFRYSANKNYYQRLLRKK